MVRTVCSGMMPVSSGEFVIDILIKGTEIEIRVELSFLIFNQTSLISCETKT